MDSRSTLLRSLRLLALLLQLALPSLGVVADAHLEVASSDDRIHVESDTHPCEERGHPEHCAICQFLRGAIVTPRTEAAVPVVASRALPPAAQDGRAAFRPSLPTLPRGPPLFS